MSTLMLVLFDVAVKGTAVLLAAVALALVLRRTTAALRHTVWSLALVGLLFVPALTLLPGWQLPIALPCFGVAATPSPDSPPSPPAPMAALAEMNPAAAQPANCDVAPAGVAPTSPKVNHADDVAPAVFLLAPGQPVRSAAGDNSLGWQLLALWAVGVLVSGLTIALALVRLRRLARRCRPLEDGPVFELAAQLARELGIRRPVRLVTSPTRAIPMTWGCFRPTVLLPEEAAQWSPEQLRMVLLHELGHILRWDCLTHFAGHIARCLFWFHPLAWWALAKQRQEQEQACDDLVVTHGASAQDYAEHLLAVTAQLPAGFFGSALALGMARSARLRERLVALLDARRNRGPARRRQLFVAGLVALALVVPAASAKWALPPCQPQDAVGVFEPGDCGAGDEQPAVTQDALKKLEDIRKKLREHYVDPFDDKLLAEAAIKGLLQGLKDPYTDYLPADELNMFSIQSKGAFVGIGAQLKMVDERLTVLTPLDNSPALKAGLRPGDVIDAIDGRPTRGVELTQLIKRILGENNTVVKLKVVRHDGAIEELAVTRGPIRVASVQGFQRNEQGTWRHMLDTDQKVGYLRILQFSTSTAKETRAVVEQLQRDGMKGLILDLRFCPGGFLDQAIGVCKLFAAQGDLLTVKGAGKNVTKFETTGKDALGDFPMVILVNDQTASAAEIVAGALHDRDRAILVGARTFGKGSVQTIVNLDGGGALKVTTAYYVLPSGRTVHKRPGEKSWGVDPTDGYYVPLTVAQVEALQKNQQERFTVGLTRDDQPKPVGRITPKVIEEQFADPQLAAAQRTLVARLTGGEFLKIGHPAALAQDQALKLEDMRQRRETLLKNLKQLERDIDAAQQTAGKK